MHAAVYTAIIDQHDDLHQPVAQDTSCEFICFTDAPWPSRVGAWKIVRLRHQPRCHPRMQAKWFKLLSQRVFPRGRLAWRYAPFQLRRRLDLTVWVDASIAIKSASFVRDMHLALAGREWAMFRHPDRDCIYDEAHLSVSLPKYDGLPILNQVEAYRDSLPSHAGLFACGIIARQEPVGRTIRKINTDWWEENVRWTYQDQLSLPYVLRRRPGHEPAIIPGKLRENDWFSIKRHNRQS